MITHEQFRLYLELPFDAAYDAEPIDYQQAEKTPGQLAEWNTWLETYLNLTAVNRTRFGFIPHNRYQVHYQLTHRYNRRVETVFLGFASDYQLTAVFEQPEPLHRPQQEELTEADDVRFVIKRVPVLTLGIPLVLIKDVKWLGACEPVTV
jgi:hypothetical protein